MMTPIAHAHCQALLNHHRRMCEKYIPEQRRLDDCTITYTDLCVQAGHPGFQQSVGPFLGEVAEWCVENGFPPLNSLAVLIRNGRPGEMYDEAPGCSNLNWDNEAAACLSFEDYPEAAPDRQ